MKIKITTENPNRRISFIAYAALIGFIVTRNSLITYIASFTARIIGNISYTATPTILFLMLLIIAHRKRNTKYMAYSDLLVPAFLILCCICNLIIYPDNTEYLVKNLNSYVLYCIPAYFIGLCSVEYDKDMFHIVSLIAVISIITSYYYTFGLSSGSGSITYDELGQSYAVLPSTLFVIAYYIFTKKKIYLIWSILGAVYAFVLGSRGPVILLAVFIPACIILADKDHNIKKILLIVLISVSIIAIFQSKLYIAILLAIKDIFSRLSVSTRVIDFIISGRYLSYTSGRSDLYDTLVRLLAEKPLIGYGWFGEWKYLGWNAHQLYLEVLFEYGYILGSILIAWYIKNVIPSFLREENKENRLFMLIFITFVLLQGIMSYSHLRPELFLLLGFCRKRSHQRVSI